jgi:hypothetical protein
MTLKEFILSAPQQDDESINYVLDLLKAEKDLPETVESISKVIYLKLNTQQTTAFQKTVMMYFFTENNYQQPQDPAMLNKINFIVELQNNDTNYKFK